VAGRTLAAAGCTKAWLATPWLHQGCGWLSPHNPLMMFMEIYWTTLILVIYSTNKMVIPLFAKFTYVRNHMSEM
jgi:hypothetical protein